MSTGPIAEERPHKVRIGAVDGETRAPEGHTPIAPPIERDDPWFWLRDDDRKNKEILGHLELENDYGAAETKHLDPLRETLYAEHKGHLKETDEAPPYPDGGFEYFTRTEEGKSYSIYCRRPAGSSETQVYLDVNVLAKDEDGNDRGHCDVRAVKPSPDHTLLAYSADYSGNETYEVRVVDIATGAALEDAPVTGTHGGCSWGADGTTFFYTTEDPAKRPWKVWRHVVGSPQSEDVCLLTEEDERFNVGVGKTVSGRFLIITSESSETSESHFIDLEAGPDAPLVVLQPRKFGLRYYPDHHGDNFIIVTNADGATEMKVVKAPLASPGLESWVDVLPAGSGRMIEDIQVFKDHVVIEGREGGLTRVWVMDVAAGEPDAGSLRMVQFQDDLYEAGISTNKVFDSRTVRLHYSSLASPLTWFDLDMAAAATTPAEWAAALTTVKQKEVLDFNPAYYATRRVKATASDGAEIPISMVFRTDLHPHRFAEDAAAHDPVPLMLYGYGSYGICIDPGFDARLLPYLDRGMVFAIAHIRGGGEMGRYWYEEQGKYLNKRNTFTDFIACAEHLVAAGVSTPDRMAIEGRSAGGLLMGAVLNMRPDICAVAVAGVPFVDVVNTMCDPSIPLTTGEWEEWGNPNEWKYHDYMLSYSPYDNVRAQPYPNIVITAGLHDPRVAYWEPAKWASKLRKLKTDANQIIVKMDLDSGHFSASDRYKYLREKAWEQAIVLEKVGLGDESRRPYPAANL